MKDTWEIIIRNGTINQALQFYGECLFLFVPPWRVADSIPILPNDSRRSDPFFLEINLGIEISRKRLKDVAGGNLPSRIGCPSLLDKLRRSKRAETSAWCVAAFHPLFVKTKKVNQCDRAFDRLWNIYGLRGQSISICERAEWLHSFSKGYVDFFQKISPHKIDKATQNSLLHFSDILATTYRRQLKPSKKGS